MKMLTGLIFGLVLAIGVSIAFWNFTFIDNTNNLEEIQKEKTNQSFSQKNEAQIRMNRVSLLYSNLNERINQTSSSIDNLTFQDTSARLSLEYSAYLLEQTESSINDLEFYLNLVSEYWSDGSYEDVIRVLKIQEPTLLKIKDELDYIEEIVLNATRIEGNFQKIP